MQSLPECFFEYAGDIQAAFSDLNLRLPATNGLGERREVTVAVGQEVDPLITAATPQQRRLGFFLKGTIHKYVHPAQQFLSIRRFALQDILVDIASVAKNAQPLALYSLRQRQQGLRLFERFAAGKPATRSRSGDWDR